MSDVLRAGYKLTEVGVIPEDWTVMHISDLATVSSGGTPSRENAAFWNGEIPWITTSKIDFNIITEADEFISDLGLKSSAAKLFSVGTLLVALYGQGKTRGKVAILGIEATTNQACAAISLFGDIFREYLFHFLISQYEVIRKSSNSGSQENLNGKIVKNLLIVCPPYEEQRAIAAALSDIDTLLAKLDTLIAKKRNIKQATMQQLLTGQTRLPGFSGEWEVKRLGDVASFYKGKGLPKSSLTPSGSEPCIHYGELFTRYPETIGEIISRTDDSQGSFRSIANDVLMPTSDVTPRGLAKASCVRVNDVILGGDILVIRSDRKSVYGSFLSYVIRHEEGQVLQLVTGSTVFHLYGSDMKKFTFSMPKLAEQTAIASVLSDMDTELAILETRRDKTQALKQGMMQELLTGRIRLV